MLVYRVENVVYEVLAFLTKLVVDFMTLDQEHIHSNLKRHVFSDVPDCFVISVNFSLEFVPIKGFLFQELIDTILLFQYENVVVIYVQGLIDDRQVVLNCLSDGCLCFLDNLIISWHVPKM